MAKTPAVAKVPEEELPPPATNVVPLHTQGVPMEFADDMSEHAGAGISDRQEDFLLPMLYIAQSGTPQVKRQQPNYIPGLEPGDIFNTATGQFWKGDDGLLVVPAFYNRSIVEWILRKSGGGYVATHSIDSGIMKRARPVSMDGDENSKRMVMMLDNGHQLVETAYQFVVEVDSGCPAVIPMSSTALQTSRQWQTLMQRLKIRNSQGAMVMAPCFASVYKLRTAYRQNDAGDWFQPVITYEGWATGTQELDWARNTAKQFFMQASKHGVQLGRPPEGAMAADDTPPPRESEYEDEPPI